MDEATQPLFDRCTELADWFADVGGFGLGILSTYLLTSRRKE
jgi:hypothetical protein